MPYALRITLDGVPPINAADNRSWRVRKNIKDEWYDLIHYATLRKRPPEPLEFAKVAITRCTSMMPDYDNLQHGAKFLLDGLKRAGVIADDKPRCIGVPLAYWERAKPGESQIRIEVVECAMHDLDLSPWNTRAAG